MQWLVYYIVAINVVSFIVFAHDKRKAKRQQWRTPESTLWTLAVVGGTVGSLLAMSLLRHKTKHITFKVGIPALFVLQLFLVTIALGGLR